MNNKFWLGDVLDCCMLSEIVEFWYNLYGCFLEVGEKIYKKLELIVVVLGNFFVYSLSGKDFVYYCFKCLFGEIYFFEKWKKGVKLVIVNLE